MEREKLIGLITRAQQGDSGAMNELFEAFYNDVYYFAIKTVKDTDTACDITQETFLEIFRSIGGLKNPVAFVTWMKQITYHQCTRYFRKKKDVLVEEDEDGNTIFDTIADEREGALPAEVYEKEEFRKIILDIINNLTEEQRSAVMMYYFDEMSIGQIAAIQGVSEGTVKSRLNYARKAIKKAIEKYEQENNIKMHSFSFLPLFMLFFGQETMPAARAAEAKAALSLSAGGTEVPGGAVSSAAGAAAAASGAGGAGAASGGLMAKIAAWPLVTKIAAVIAAVAIAAGGAAALVPSENGHTEHDSNADCLCDTCGEEMHSFAEGDHVRCLACGADLFNFDADADSLCDECGEYPCGATHQLPHTYADGTCTFCGAEDDPHFDNDADGICDHCGTALCLLGRGEHRIPEESCFCMLCGAGGHVEGDVHPYCSVCEERLPMTDQNNDGACDICGEYACGGIHRMGSHQDGDGDSKCDICAKYMCGLIWGLEHNMDYSDGIYDGKCDDCGGSPYAMGYAEEDSRHADSDGDSRCDCCDVPVCDAYGMPEFGGVDADGDEKCDICGLFMCDGHDGFVYHYDFDGDTKCDRCSHFICAHGYLPHVDDNGDGKCENCHGFV